MSTKGSTRTDLVGRPVLHKTVLDGKLYAVWIYVQERPLDVMTWKSINACSDWERELLADAKWLDRDLFYSFLRGKEQ